MSASRLSNSMCRYAYDKEKSLPTSDASMHLAVLSFHCLTLFAWSFSSYSSMYCRDLWDSITSSEWWSSSVNINMDGEWNIDYYFLQNIMVASYRMVVSVFSRYLAYTRSLRSRFHTVTFAMKSSKNLRKNDCFSCRRERETVVILKGTSSSNFQERSATFYWSALHCGTRE